MKKLVALAFFMLALSQCVSFKIAIPDEQDEMVDYLAICKTLNKEGNFEKEIPSEIIQKTDQVVYAVIKVNNISKPLSLQWKWYSPKLELAKTSKTLEVNKNEKYLEFFAAWDTLTNAIFKDQPGKWLVVITCQNHFLYKKEFEIR